MTGTDTGTGALDCGKTIEQISDYVAHDRIPYDPDIERCPECMNALRALERVTQLSRDLIADDARRLPPPPAAWLDRIIDNIRAEVHAGRDIPLHHDDPRVTITVTEGAVRALLRSVGDAIPGVIVGACRITGPAEILDAAVVIDITASVAAGSAIPPLVAELRRRVLEALSQHTELNVSAVNVTVQDLHVSAPGEENS